MKTKIISTKKKGALQKAIKALKKGKIIIYPTETSYGIGCLGKKGNAIKKIHSIKKEPVSKSLIVLVPNLKVAKQFGKLTKKDENLVKQFMPGPLTLVVEKKIGISNYLGKKTIAFRISSNTFAYNLSKNCGAIVSTSANIHRKKPIFSVKQSLKEFNGKVDLIVDAGTLPKRNPSTVYDSKNDKIIRKGKISLGQIRKVAPEAHSQST